MNRARVEYKLTEKNWNFGRESCPSVSLSNLKPTVV